MICTNCKIYDNDIYSITYVDRFNSPDVNNQSRPILISDASASYPMDWTDFLI